jgi:hypothetical protein
LIFQRCGVSENTVPPGGVVILLQIEDDSDEILAYQKRILYLVFEVHHVVKSRSVALEPALGPGEKVSVLQDSDEMTVHHPLHCLT